MRKINRFMALILALTMVLSTAVVGFAEGEDSAPTTKEIETGFYIKDIETGNKFIDIYTFLNGDYEDLITEVGLGNVLFVHQSGKGGTLENILTAETIEAGLKFLEEKDFEPEYTDERTKETIKPEIIYVLDAKLDKDEYTVDDDITVSGKVLYKNIGLPNVDITMKLEDTNQTDALIEVLWVEQLQTSGTETPDATTNEDGTFTHTFKVPAETLPGTYKLTVKANDPVNKSIELDVVIVEESVDEIPTEIIQDIVNKMTELYKHIDENDKQAIKDARANLGTLEDETWTALLTYEVIARFESEDAAKEAIESAIIDLSELYYSADSQELEGRLTILAEKHLPTYRTIFGYEETAEDLFNFFKALIENIPNGITPSIGNELIEANDTRLLELIDEIAENTLYYTLDNEYQNFNGKLSEVGLSVDTLLNVRKNVANAIDDEGKAQIAIINAYARMNAKVDGPTELTIGQTGKYTLTVLGKEVSTLANWASSNEEVATININLDEDKIVLTASQEGTTTITVYRGTNPANWIAKFEVKINAKDVEEVPNDPENLEDLEEPEEFEDSGNLDEPTDPEIPEE